MTCLVCVIDFNSLVHDCINAVTTMRSLTGNNIAASRKRKRGPECWSVKAKFYHLPEASAIPRFFNHPIRGRDQLLINHMNSGYGKICLFISYVMHQS